MALPPGVIRSICYGLRIVWHPRTPHDWIAYEYRAGSPSQRKGTIWR